MFLARIATAALQAQQSPDTFLSLMLTRNPLTSISFIPIAASKLIGTATAKATGNTLTPTTALFFPICSLLPAVRFAVSACECCSERNAQVRECASRRERSEGSGCVLDIVFATLSSRFFDLHVSYVARVDIDFQSCFEVKPGHSARKNTVLRTARSVEVFQRNTDKYTFFLTIKT